MTTSRALEAKAFEILTDTRMFGESVQKIWVAKPTQTSLYSTSTFQDSYGDKKQYNQKLLGFVSLGKLSKMIYLDKFEPLLGFSIKGLNTEDQNLLREIIAGWLTETRARLHEMYDVKGSHKKTVFVNGDRTEQKLFFNTEIMDERIGMKFEPTREKPQNIISIGAMIRVYGRPSFQAQIAEWKKRRDAVLGKVALPAPAPTPTDVDVTPLADAHVPSASTSNPDPAPPPPTPKPVEEEIKVAEGIPVGQPMSDSDTFPKVRIHMKPESVHVSVSIPRGKSTVSSEPSARRRRCVDSSDDEDDDEDLLPKKKPCIQTPAAVDPSTNRFDEDAVLKKYADTKKNNRSFPDKCPPKFKLVFYRDEDLGLVYYTEKRKNGKTAGGCDSYIDIVPNGAIYNALKASWPTFDGYNRIRSNPDIKRLAETLTNINF